ncbi:hypothetical protein NQ814_18860, partial [Acinetobacter baumannii]|nr:hypothetical protein [Acinetobacter baumannii]
EHSLSIDGNNATLKGIVDGLPITMNMWLTKVGTTGELTVFNFASDYVNGVLQRNLGDDVAPMRLDGTTVGANHGYRKTNLTAGCNGIQRSEIES